MLAMRWAQALEDHGIPCLPLKGALLAQRVHGDPGLRPSGDIDLLVPPGRLSEAVDLLMADGYAPPSDRTDARGLPELHFRLDHPGGALPRVELHWRVHWYESAFSERLLQESRFGEDGYRVALPEQELAALLLFYARDGLMGLRLLTDVASWWDANGARIPSGGLQRVAEAHRELAPALATSARLAARLSGAPTDELIDPAPALTRRSEAAARLANPLLAGSTDRKITNYHLVDLLLSPAGERAAAVRRHLVRQPRPRTGLSSAFERIRMALRPPTRLVKSGVALWGIRAGRAAYALDGDQALERRGADR
jgi:hypothetical protein